MPDGYSARSAGRIREANDAVRARLRSPLAVRDVDERRHGVVDIATKRDYAGLVEHDRSRLVFGEQFQLELLRRREGIHMMAARIEVQEGHSCPDRNDQHEWMKLHVLLGHAVIA